MKSSARFSVGIDLGTTNSAVAFIDTASCEKHAQIFAVPQIVAPGEVEAREVLPSFHYAPAVNEFGREGLRLPWDAAEPSDWAVGVFARDHGANVPGRLIVSAKSWLCHTGVDRTADLLPWHGAPDTRKLSPSEASARYLGHIRAAWNQRWPEHPLEGEDVVVTIPASFDEIARELTVAAARRAGLPRITLLEEPQAAFYSWVHEHGAAWDEALRPGQKILVCDIGGGTSDFTLIEVRPGERGQVKFHRFAVGDHLILGGDNLDLALAHFVEQRLGVELEARQWGVLVRRCREVKETLLGPFAQERLTLNIPRTGAKLIAGALQVEVTRDEVAALLVDGFLPRVGIDEKPVKRASGFQEFGLPYAPDPAITRYLAAFLTAHNTGAPDVVLFNGGLFESPMMRDRLIEVLASWFGAKPLVLENKRLDLAVALGAANYGIVRRGIGTRISGGLARAYYIGVQHGDEKAAVCLVPSSLEEGQQVDMQREFALLVRQPAAFPLYVSSLRTNDQPGDLVPIDPEQLTALPPIKTALRSRGGEESGAIRVRLHAQLSEIGTLEVSCGEVDGERKWKLPFDVRATTQTDVAAHDALGEEGGIFDNATVQSCRDAIRAAFGAESSADMATGLVKKIEQASGSGRFDWPPSLLRNLWEELMQVEPGRARSATHEARWLNLTGFSLRPGFGLAVDDWRVAQTWRLFEHKIIHGRNELCRAEWWILWRRIAGGLTAGQQRVIAEPLMATLRKKSARREKMPWGSHESAEIWRFLASLELLDAGVRIELGNRLLPDLADNKIAVWALGRLGERVPMYGPINTIVPAETAKLWAQRLMGLARHDDELLFAVTQIARRTGDRYRDLPADTRDRIADWLTGHDAPPHFIDMVRVGGNIRDEEQSRVFGESLPHGLRVMGG